MGTDAEVPPAADAAKQQGVNAKRAGPCFSAKQARWDRYEAIDFLFEISIINSINRILTMGLINMNKTLKTVLIISSIIVALIIGT